MLTQEELHAARERAAAALAEAGIALTSAERAGIEVADFGLSRLDEIGLSARRLREHGSRLRQGARALPGSDVPRASAPARGWQPWQGGDLSLSARVSSTSIPRAIRRRIRPVVLPIP